METQTKNQSDRKFWYGNRSKLIIVILTILLIGLSFYGYFHQQANLFLGKVSTRISESSDFVAVIDKGLSYTSSLNVPLIDGYAEDAEKDLTKISNYLTVAQILVELQMAILKISNITFFKILAILFLLGLFIQKHKRTAFKFLLICLMINPGLSIYINTIHETAKIAKFNLGIDLHQKLSDIKSEFTVKENELKQKQQSRKQKQLEEAEKKGKDRIGFIKRAEDAVVDTVEDVGIKVTEEVQLAEEIVKVDTETLLVHLINLITSILLLYLILPLLYFYLINLILKNLLQFSLNDIIDSII